MDAVCIDEMPEETVIALLEELGYSTDGEYIYDLQGNHLIDRYVKIKVKFDNFVIFPGSILIFDDNPISMANYFEEHEDILDELGDVFE